MPVATLYFRCSVSAERRDVKGNVNAHVEYAVCDGKGIFKVQRPPMHRALVALVRRKVFPVRSDVFADGYDYAARHGGVVDEQ